MNPTTSTPPDSSQPTFFETPGAPAIAAGPSAPSAHPRLRPIQRHQIEMPITTEMYRVLYENEAPRDAIQRLMSRSLKAEAAR